MRAIFLLRTGLAWKPTELNAAIGHMLFRNYIREVLANEKALLDLVLHRKPKYLGETIPITGDGRNYP